MLLMLLLTTDESTRFNSSLEKRNLAQTFGRATLRFDTNGSKVLVNIKDVAQDNLKFYLKKPGNTEEEISVSVASSTTDSGLYDANGNHYYTKSVSYSLTNPEDEIIIELISKPNTFQGLFAFSDAIKITLENFATEDITTMEFMFLKCGSLSQLDLSSFNTSSVTNMNSMFYGCFKTNTIRSLKLEHCKSHGYAVHVLSMFRFRTIRSLKLEH